MDYLAGTFRMRLANNHVEVVALIHPHECALVATRRNAPVATTIKHLLNRETVLRLYVGYPELKVVEIGQIVRCLEGMQYLLRGGHFSLGVKLAELPTMYIGYVGASPSSSNTTKSIGDDFAPTRDRMPGW